MKKFFIFLTVASFVLLLFACKREMPYDFSDTKNNTLIYMPQAARGSDGLLNVKISKPAAGASDSIYRFSFGAYYPGSAPAPEDIAVTFAIDYSRLDSINNLEAQNGRPPYEMLPDTVLQLPALEGKIPANSRIEQNLSFGISSATIKQGHKYIFPITLKTVSGGYKINSRLATTWFAINVM
jgi:hypothetical protein